MAGGASTLTVRASGGAHARAAVTEPTIVRWVLIGVALTFLGLFLLIPLVAVFVEGLADGVATYFDSLTQPAALRAIRITLLTAAVSVPVGTLFGIAAAWAIAKFDFVGKNVLITLIDLPFSVSPVIAGLMVVLMFNPYSRGRPVA